MRLAFPLTALFAACAGCGTEPGATPASEGDRVAVYVAVLRDALGADAYAQAALVPTTVPFGGAFGEDVPTGDFARPFDGLRPGTVEALRAARVDRRLPSELTALLPVTWFTDADFEALPAAPPGTDVDELGWVPFHARFPGSVGHVRLSDVAFSQDGTEALVYRGVQRGGLDGTGYLLRLRRNASGWQVVERNLVWIS